MEFTCINESRFDELCALHTAYKAEIGETAPTKAELASLEAELSAGGISFFGCIEDGRLVAVCSVCTVFTTFNYQKGGVLEDFYVLPQYRHKGIAGALVRYAYLNSGINSLTVGCADCDTAMYGAIGFKTKLGNMMAYDYREDEYGRKTKQDG